MVLYPVWTQNEPNSYTVTLPTGTGYAIKVQEGSSSPVIQGGNFRFTVVINSGYHKGASFAVKANGVTLIADSNGVYTISNITQAQEITVEGVEKDSIIPEPEPKPEPKPEPEPEPTPTEQETVDEVYNNSDKSKSTIWLTGKGFLANEMLLTQALSQGRDYNAMLKLADGEEVLWVYEITLSSGRKSTESPMYINVVLGKQYAGQKLTLVHKKADGSYEYFYATADAEGKAK